MTSDLLRESSARRSAKSTAVYTAQEVADLLCINRNRVYREATAGNVPCLRFGKRFVFPKKAVDAWLDSAGGQVETTD